MANPGVKGRPIAPLVLSAQERTYLERQVRRHRVARSLSERCRVILRCADGLASKDVAAELGLHEHTVGKWRRRFLKDRCEGLLDEAPLKDPVKDKLKRFGLFTKFGEDKFFPTIGAAVALYLKSHDVPWVDWEDQTQ